MPIPRRSRFKRDESVSPITLTDRDREILRLVYRNRFLRSSHIVALLAGKPQPILRRLHLLYHHGFLTRPRAQIEYFHEGGNHHLIYGLGNKGAEILKPELGSAFRKVNWSEKNRRVRRLYFEHTILVSDIMVAITLACHKAGNVRLVTAEELLTRQNHPATQTFKWNVTVNSHRVGIMPDRVFALEVDGESPAFFFLEADRGTMPVIRKNLAQSSFYRKLLAYSTTWSTGLHRSLFGFHRFRVLTVTTSSARVESIINACTQLKRGQGLFLITDASRFLKSADVFALSWKTGRPGVTSTLLN